MKELIEYIALSLVDDPSQVVVNQNRVGGRETLELHVAKEDMGRVIGKAGRVANAMNCERSKRFIFVRFQHFSIVLHFSSY